MTTAAEKHAAAKAKARARKASKSPGLVEIIVREGTRKVRDGMHKASFWHLLALCWQELETGRVRRVVFHLDKPPKQYLGSTKGD